MEKVTISIAFVNEALECLRTIDPNWIELAVNAGISPELLETPQARVSARQYCMLWKLIATKMNDEFLGMDSRRMKCGSFTLLCHSVIHCDILESAMQRATRFMRIILDGTCSHLLRDGDLAYLVLEDTDEQVAVKSNAKMPPKRPFAYGTYLLMLHGLACWLIGRQIPVIRADFCCREPYFSGEWRVLFSQELHFEQPQTRIIFSAQYLGLQNIQNERTMEDFLRSAPASFLLKDKSSGGLTAQIRRRLRRLRPKEWPGFVSIARSLYLSETTLRRRLDQEGQSYRQIMSDLRRDLAIGLLGDTDKSIAEIAEHLGFAEPSAFHRAFKKWTGSRPGEYRLASQTTDLAKNARHDAIPYRRSTFL
ncbi:MAG TPA: AraC family transcriptional regulator [Noviherbaspirillum sp.]|nr:AraC family transcriptional regulator [Noviherbaspirillum sp.]